MDSGGRITWMQTRDSWIGRRLGDAMIALIGLALALPLILPFG